MESISVEVAGARLEVFDWGSGEPVLFVQTALTADELRPLATDPALDGYRKILYHRRGYAGSSPDDGQASIHRAATDCANLLTELGVDRAHVVGLSYAGAVGLQLAAQSPERTRTLTLLEPPPVHVSGELGGNFTPDPNAAGGLEKRVIGLPGDTDNRSYSQDSRAFGPVPRDAIFARTVLIYWPFDRFGTPTYEPDRTREPPGGPSACDQ